MTIDIPEYFQYESPIRTVAVIGAGVSGVPATRHLREAGLEVTVFERQSKAGGIWNWSPEITKPLSVPTPAPSHGAFFPQVPAEAGPEPVTKTLDDADHGQRLRFSPPNPVYWSLSNNVPIPTMAFKDWEYPPGTAENIRHDLISDYVHSYVKHFNIDESVSYNTRVENAVKIPKTDNDGAKWRLTLRKVVPEGDDKVKETFWTQDFDAVIVATGHYNAPFIPDFEGSDKWAAAYPEHVLHSNGYRVPEPYAGKDVLVVGCGTSGIDMARDLEEHVSKVYMVGRKPETGPDAYKSLRNWQRRLLPKNGELVDEIKRFIPPAPGAPIEEGQIELVDGRIITNISLIIFATGYQYSYPFFPQFHRDPALGAPTPEEKKNLLITDGASVLNLYRDIFYIPDPTLAFLGLSVNTSAFSFFEYQAQSIVRVLAGTARLPSTPEQWKFYNTLVARTGDGKFVHFLGKDGERAYVRHAVEWINRDAEWSGAPKITGHSEEWIKASDNILASIALKYGIDAETARELRQNSTGGTEPEIKKEEAKAEEKPAPVAVAAAA